MQKTVVPVGTARAIIYTTPRAPKVATGQYTGRTYIENENQVNGKALLLMSA